MKNFKSVLVIALFALAVCVPMAANGKVHAAPTNLLCSFVDGEFPSTTSVGCDLSLVKQVKVNSGSFVDADTAGAAAQAQIGDAVVWQITITNTSVDPSYTPFGIVTVHDVLPAGVTAGSVSASTGIYNSTTGDWTFTLGQNLPATLTLNSTAAASGLIKNTAAFTDYDPDNCDGPCVDPPFNDADPSNNTNDAYVNVAVVPVVTPAVVVPPAPAPTLVNTGVSPVFEMIAALSLTAVAVVIFKYNSLKSLFAKLRG